MSNARTGMWSAVGALFGGIAGVAAARYIVETRPRSKSASQHDRGAEIEDAMIVGGATGAVLGAFIAGAATGEEALRPRLKSGENYDAGGGGGNF